MRKTGLTILALLTVLSFAPVISLTLAEATAAWFGCRLDEGSAHGCVAAGVEIGDALYAADVLGWLMLLTWPGMLVSLGPVGVARAPPLEPVHRLAF